MKPFHDDSSDSFFPLVKSKIIPLPLIRTKFKETSKLDKKLTVHGCKYFQKVAALGQDTPKILEHIRKLSNLKYVRSFEFDPYLCEESCLNYLERVLDRIKGRTKDINIFIRRVQGKEEIRKISKGLVKQDNRMTKLRIEISSTEKLYEKDLRPIGRAVSMRQRLKSLEMNVICLPNIGQNGFKQLVYKLRKLQKLDHLKLFPYAFYSPQNEYKDKVVRFPKLKVKSFTIKMACKSNWTSMTDGEAQFLPVYIESLGNALNPIKFAYTIHNLPTSTEAIYSLSQLMPKLSKTKSFFLELENNKLNEAELMLLANGIRKAIQIEELTFKFIEHSYIGLEYLVGFVRIVSQCNFLKKCDLFFRKLKYSEWDAAELGEQLSMIENIQYELTKESLHVSFIKKIK